jgi:hypothetical protein
MSQTESEFWAAETQRRMTEHNQRALADAARQRASAPAQVDYGLDGAHATARREYEEMRKRELAASHEAYLRACEAKRADDLKHMRTNWSGIDWDGLSQTESAYRTAQDRQARWQQYRATAQAAESGWVRYEQPPQWFK